MTRVQRCAVCGCTDDAACAGGCEWIQARLCSTCLPAVRATVCPEASCGASGKWCRRPSGHSGPMVAFHAARLLAAAAMPTVIQR